jgi:hypothetical protein
MEEGLVALQPDALPPSATASRAREDAAVVYSQVHLIVDYLGETKRLGIRLRDIVYEAICRIGRLSGVRRCDRKELSQTDSKVKLEYQFV